jgi:hypothetical protein
LFTATTDGTNRSPSAEGITTGSPPLITAATELVVPKSIPMIFAMISILLCQASKPGNATHKQTDT